MWVAAVQLKATPDQEANLARAEALIEEAASQGAQLVALPEHCACYGRVADTTAAAQPLDGPLVSRFKKLAARLRIFLLPGSFLERTPGKARPNNTSVLIDPRGQIIACYRKVHLYDVEVPGGPVYRESEWTQPGEEVVTAALPGQPFTAGLALCYDLRFPELFRQQVDQGANLILLPSAFMAATGRDHWEVLLRARAIENLAYVVAPNQYGEHAPGLRSYGRSLIVDPWGTILAQAPDGEGVICARLDYERLQHLRRSLPVLSHRRLR
jgi:deaminated glutathione amidase